MGPLEARLIADIVELARQYGRYGYRKIAELLRRAGWLVNDKQHRSFDAQRELHVIDPSQSGVGGDFRVGLARSGSR